MSDDGSILPPYMSAVPEDNEEYLSKVRIVDVCPVLIYHCTLVRSNVE